MPEKYHQCSNVKSCAGCKNRSGCEESSRLSGASLEQMRISGLRCDEIGIYSIRDLISYTPVYNNKKMPIKTINELYTYIGSMNQRDWDLFKVMYKLHK